MVDFLISFPSFMDPKSLMELALKRYQPILNLRILWLICLHLITFFVPNDSIFVWHSPTWKDIALREAAHIRAAEEATQDDTNSRSSAHQLEIDSIMDKATLVRKRYVLLFFYVLFEASVASWWFVWCSHVMRVSPSRNLLYVQNAKPSEAMGGKSLDRFSR